MAETITESGNTDLEILQKEGITVKVGNEDVTVKPFTFGQLLKALKYLSNISTSFSNENLTEAEIFQIFALNSEDIVGLLSLATGRDRDYFDTISPDAGIDLTKAAWEVNKDFFVNRLAPKIRELTGQKPEIPIAEDGSQPSSVSSSTDTEETK